MAVIEKHLWSEEPVLTSTGRWRMDDKRTCSKCGAVVKYVSLPRYGSRVFVTTFANGKVSRGAMSKCKP